MSKNMPADQRFVVCIRTDEHEMDLALHKIYAVLPDPLAERDGWIRVVDETGEDYLYPEDCFRPVEVSRALGEELLRAS
ncbi:MAG TPA: hypothetical protein VLK84_11005 [Longimicrobium sp.]|nr:hypothetical protein [Longimicrobium sp.]